MRDKPYYANEAKTKTHWYLGNSSASHGMLKPARDWDSLWHFPISYCSSPSKESPSNSDWISEPPTTVRLTMTTTWTSWGTLRLWSNGSEDAPDQTLSAPTSGHVAAVDGAPASLHRVPESPSVMTCLCWYILRANHAHPAVWIKREKHVVTRVRYGDDVNAPRPAVGKVSPSRKAWETALGW